MNNITPLERIRKVYKDKVDNFEKYSAGNVLLEKQEQEAEDLENIEVSSEELKAKRKTQSRYMRTYSGEVNKVLNEHQYRVQLSKKSMEIDNM